MITGTDLGWFAGVLDTRGHVTVKENGQRASPQVVLYVVSSCFPVVDRLGELTGGTPEELEPSGLVSAEIVRKGCAEHCPEAHVHVWPGREMPPQRRWSASGAAAAVILWNLRGLMVGGTEPWAEALALALGYARLSGQGSGAILAAIRRLHALGWELPPLMKDAIPGELAAT